VIKLRYIFALSHNASTCGEKLLLFIVIAKDYKGVYRLASKIKDEGFEADLYKKH
jgi:hypothetical protein